MMSNQLHGIVLMVLLFDVLVFLWFSLESWWWWWSDGAGCGLRRSYVGQVLLCGDDWWWWPMPPAQNPSFVRTGCQKTVLLRNIQYYCSNMQPRTRRTMVVNERLQWRQMRGGCLLVVAVVGWHRMAVVGGSTLGAGRSSVTEGGGCCTCDNVLANSHKNKSATHLCRVCASFKTHTCITDDGHLRLCYKMRCITSGTTKQFKITLIIPHAGCVCKARLDTSTVKPCDSEESTLLHDGEESTGCIWEDSWKMN